MMNTLFNHPMWSTHALLLGRVLMGGFFLLAGIQKFQGIDGVAGYIASAGLPAAMVLAWLAAILEVAAGAAIILGKYFKEATISLGVFVLFISFIFHSPSMWAEDPLQKMMFMKNMAIAAGLFFMAAHGAGNTWRMK
jgi:putative oxidoreductase